MVLDSLKGVVVPKCVSLMWQSPISMGKNFLGVVGGSILNLAKEKNIRDGPLKLFTRIVYTYVLCTSNLN